MWSDVEFEIDVGEGITFDLSEADAVEFGETEYIAIVESDMPDYDGAYEVTPTAAEQTMPTSNMVMRRDVTVHAVPYFETSNESGGMTVSILS